MVLADQRHHPVDVACVQLTAQRPRGLGAGLGRTLWHVTRKADADCPARGTERQRVCVRCQPGSRDPDPPNGSPATTDLNVLGPVGGIGGSVREYTRFLCRPTANQQGFDPLLGTSYNTLISNAINAAGFQTVNSTWRRRDHAAR